MQFLLTNDDGIEGPGLVALERALVRLGSLTVIAPRHAHSGCSHCVTAHQPLELETLAPARHALHGTPADCTRVGLRVVLDHCDCIVAGINEGGNLGSDVYPSGTVAAVREAALLGKRGIAVSHYHKAGQPYNWHEASAWTEHIVKLLLDRPHVPGTFWNVNLPHLQAGADMPEIVDCPLDINPLPVEFEEVDGRLHYRGRYADRERTPGRDVDVCFSGRIAISRLSLDASLTLNP